MPADHAHTRAKLASLAGGFAKLKTGSWPITPAPSLLRYRGGKAFCLVPCGPWPEGLRGLCEEAGETARIVWQCRAFRTPTSPITPTFPCV